MLDLLVHALEDTHSEQENLAEVPCDRLVVVLERIGLPCDRLHIPIEWNQAGRLDSLFRG